MHPSGANSCEFHRSATGANHGECLRGVPGPDRGGSSHIVRHAVCISQVQTVVKFIEVPQAPPTSSAAVKVPSDLASHPRTIMEAKTMEEAVKCNYTAPKPFLVYGDWSKRYGFYFYCKECSNWVGWAKVNHQTSTCEVWPFRPCTSCSWPMQNTHRAALPEKAATHWVGLVLQWSISRHVISMTILI